MNELFESLSEQDLERLFNKINKTSDCWLWTGSKNFHFRVGNTILSARRFLFEGKLLPKHIIVSTCKNPRCVNPNHLEQIIRGKHLPKNKPKDRGKRYPVVPGYDESPIKDKPIYELTEKQIQHIFSQIEKTETCWNWLGYKTHTGRGKIKLWMLEHTVPRVMYAYHHKKDPGSWYVLHTCHRPICVNPDHLYLGTAKDNMQDCISSGRFVASKGNTKIREANEEQMKILKDPTLTRVEKAELLGICTMRVTVWTKKLGLPDGRTFEARQAKGTS